MILTGWTEAELGQASPKVIRELHHRIEAGRMWTPEATQALYATAPFGDARAAIAVEKARHAAREIHALLFPED